MYVGTSKDSRFGERGLREVLFAQRKNERTFVLWLFSNVVSLDAPLAIANNYRVLEKTETVRLWNMYTITRTLGKY